MPTIAPGILWARDDTNEMVDSNGGAMLAVTGVLMGITFVVVALRIYIRQVMLKSFSIDDAVILVALIMAIMSMVCFVGMVRNGAGRYPKDIKSEWKEGLAFWSYIIGVFFVTGISLVKISIGFFLKRFAQTLAQHRFLWVIISFCVVFMVYSVITFVIACIPLEAIWVPGLRQDPNFKCQSGQVLSIIGTVNGVINVLTDLIFCLLPVPVVLALAINRRTRVTLFLILSLGLFACAASIARMILGRRRLKDPNFTRHYNFLVWFYIELQVGILAASLPSLRPLFSKLLKGTSTPVVLSGGNYNYGSRSGYGPRTKSGGGRGHSGYYRQEDLVIPLESVAMSGRYDERGDADSIKNIGGNSHYKAQASSGTPHAGDLADDDSEKGMLPLGGIHVSRRTDISSVN